MGSALGVRKVAASRIGVTLAEYDVHVAQGEKWCTRCKTWHPKSGFGADRSRSDGLASYCVKSRVRVTASPGQRERRIKRSQGLAWCSDCRSWLPAGEVRQGRCKPHAAGRGRAYYAANADAIRARKLARARGLDPIPDWWREQRYAEFGFLCAYGCRRSARTLDHVWPVVRGGKSEPSNLVPACKSCNSGKKDAAPGPWLERFASAFPDQFVDLAALTFEHLSSLHLDEVV